AARPLPSPVPRVPGPFDGWVGWVSWWLGSSVVSVTWQLGSLNHARTDRRWQSPFPAELSFDFPSSLVSSVFHSEPTPLTLQNRRRSWPRREWPRRPALVGPLGGPPRTNWNQVAPAPGLPPLKITDIKPILPAPSRIRLLVVKVSTSEPGLYGLGCAT